MALMANTKGRGFPERGGGAQQLPRPPQERRDERRVRGRVASGEVGIPAATVDVVGAITAKPLSSRSACLRNYVMAARGAPELPDHVVSGPQ